MLKHLLFLFWPLLGLAQTYTGHVINQDTKVPLEYVSIGLLGTNVGTVSNERGRFELQIPSTNQTQSIRISLIGYESKVYTRSEFNALCSSNNCTIALKERSLPEVVIRPKKTKTKILGNTTKKKNVTVGFTNNPGSILTKGTEWGLFIRNKKDIWIKNVRININECTFDSVFFRLNIREIINDSIGESILREPIYIRSNKGDQMEFLEKDLQHLMIYTNKNFLISLELVKDLGVGSFMFCGSLFANPPIYIKRASESPWEKLPIGSIGISCEVEYEK